MTIFDKLLFISLLFVCCKTLNQNFTIVTGMWNIGRGSFSTSERGYKSFYLSFFRELLQYKGTMVIFGSDVQYEYMMEHRPKELIDKKTVFIKKNLNDFEQYWYTKKVWQAIDKMTNTQQPIQNIRRRGVPQFGIKMYNPVVMSKHRLLMEAANIDPFHSDYHLWLDGGFTHLVPFQLLQSPFFQNIFSYYQSSWLIQTGAFNFKSFSLGYKNKGSEYMLPNVKPSIEVLGNWVGGRTSAASTAYHIYQNLLRITLENGDMNTDESIFILLAERYSYFFNNIHSAIIQNKSVIAQMKIKAEKVELHDRQFIWNEQQLKNYYNFQRNSEQKPLIITKLIQTSNKDYFIKGKTLFQQVLTSRMWFLGILIILTTLICILLSNLREQRY